MKTCKHKEELMRLDETFVHVTDMGGHYYCHLCKGYRLVHHHIPVSLFNEIQELFLLLDKDYIEYYRTRISKRSKKDKSH